MLTRAQAETILLDRITDRFATWKNGVCKERALRAREHLRRGEVQPTDTAGVWRVRSSSQPDHWYTVNGTCGCIDATTKAPYGACKHRMAAKMATKLHEGMMDLVTARVVHRHPYTCGHAVGHVECWAEECTDDVVLCPGCTREEADLQEDVGEAGDRWEVEDQEDAESRPTDQAWTELPDTCEACGRHLQYCECAPPVPLTTEELAALAAPVYEANPQTVQHAVDCPAENSTEPCECVPGVRPVRPTLLTQPMPEAPASLNFKVKRGNTEIMWTMRSMTPGAGGDAELAARLPLVLDALKKAGLME